MEAVLLSVASSTEDVGLTQDTHGKQLWAHRHRRNRPCTYPNWYLQSALILVKLLLALSGDVVL